MSLKIIVMAGGRGERFWPRSRRERPKQFAKILSDDTMLSETVKRFAGVVPVSDIFVSIGASQKKVALESAPMLGEANLILEPMGRDTAAAIGLATLAAPVGDDDVLYFTPADQYIGDLKAFHEDIKRAAGLVVKEQAMTILGIKPTHPATGYGYVKVDLADGKQGPVKAFKEKPDGQTAAAYLKEGGYFWNAGMFLFTRRILRDLLTRHAPEHLEKLNAYLATVKKDPAAAEAIFASIPRISFDYAVAEKAEKILCVAAAFPWDDVGSWSAVSRLKTPDGAGNVVEGNVLTQGCEKIIALNPRKDLTLVVNHAKGITVVVEDNVIYVTDNGEEGRIKELLKSFEGKRADLL